MLQTHYRFPASALLCSLVLPALSVTAHAQTTYSANPKPSLSAALVLSPEFCATKTKKGAWGINQETFEIGKAACTELEPALKGVFSGLTRVQDASSSGEAQLVLTPRFVDIGATQKAFAFSDRELVVLVEWTVKDKSGKSLWVETVQGSAKRHIGNAFTHGKNLKKIVEDSVKDVADQTATKMSASPELHKVAEVGATTGFEKN
jgi:hypothetical protein